MPAIGQIVRIDYPETAVPETKVKVKVWITNIGDEAGFLTISLRDVETDKSWGIAGIRVLPNTQPGWGFFPIMPDRDLTLEATLTYEDAVVDSRAFTIYKKVAPPPAPLAISPILLVFLFLLMVSPREK